ncbi:hypothetical protein AL485_15940 [Serratia liquefaciens]|nr:hypothetical protein AL485_15940 [Serratia liquefaciens]
MKLQGVWIALLVALSAQASTTFTLRCTGRPVMQVSLMEGGMITMGWPGQFYVGHEGGRRHLASGDVVQWFQLQNGDELWRDNTRGRDFLSYAGSGRLTPCQAGAEQELNVQSLPRVPG